MTIHSIEPESTSICERRVVPAPPSNENRSGDEENLADTLIDLPSTTDGTLDGRLAKDIYSRHRSRYFLLVCNTARPDLADTFSQ